MQSVLVLLQMVAVLAGSFLYLHYKSKKKHYKALDLTFIPKNLLWFLLACLLGISLELILRSNSINQENIILAQRTPLYAGLLAPSALEACGNWTLEARELAAKEMQESLLPLTKKYLQQKTVKEIFSTVLCKYKRALLERYVIWWVPSLAHLQNMQQKNMWPFYHWMSKWREGKSNILLRIMLLILIIHTLYTVIVGKQFTTPIFIAIGLGIGYATVFGIFEMNPRYLTIFIGYLLLLFALHQREKNDLLLQNNNQYKKD